MNAPLRDVIDYYLSEFARLSASLPGRQLGWLRQAREAAMEHFARTGWPSLRDEDWKYTSLAAIEKARFSLTASRGEGPTPAQVAALGLPGVQRLVFVNGRFERGLSRLGGLPAGVTVGSLADHLESDGAGLEPYLAAAAPSSVFAALNLACAADGAYIRLAPGTAIDVPIELLYIATEGNLAIQPHNLIVAEEGSSAAIVEHHRGLADQPYFTNAVTRIVAGPGAAIEHHKLQAEAARAYHIASVEAVQAGDSRFTSSSFAFGAGLARVDIRVGLDAEGAACQLDGLYVTAGRQHVDHHTSIDHRQARGTSRQFYKGVLSGASRAVFNGRVVVQANAQHSDAAQTNRNLLLSENAEIDTKPQLEIWADDVKCSHGATVGQLDDDQVFYLRSRGVDEGSARALLTRAFAREVIDRVRPMPLQERLHELLLEKLPGQPKELPC